MTGLTILVIPPYGDRITDDQKAITRSAYNALCYASNTKNMKRRGVEARRCVRISKKQVMEYDPINAKNMIQFCELFLL